MTGTTEKTIEYGFTRDGGFAAVDHTKRIGAHVYPSRGTAGAIKGRPEAAARILLKNAEQWATWDFMPHHYLYIAAQLAAAKGG